MLVAQYMVGLDFFFNTRYVLSENRQSRCQQWKTHVGWGHATCDLGREYNKIWNLRINLHSCICICIDQPKAQFLTLSHAFVFSIICQSSTKVTILAKIKQCGLIIMASSLMRLYFIIGANLCKLSSVLSRIIPTFLLVE